MDGLRNEPTDAVFTTCLWDGRGQVLDWPLHLRRLEEHAHRLEFKLPDDISQKISEQLTQYLTRQGEPDGMHQLLRITLQNHGHCELTFRTPPTFQRQMRAISVEAPRWNQSITGCKHADWYPYRDAKSFAESHGTDISVFMHDNAIVDADRATPALMTNDGELWVASEQQGCVRSITLGGMMNEMVLHGFSIRYGKLTERMIRTCREFVVFGTGVGVAQITEIDGIRIGTTQSIANELRTCLALHRENPQSWTKVV
jgi:branched-subunit amino acid aminotransferase/4-amino-4-deoxychorismate lyase